MSSHRDSTHRPSSDNITDQASNGGPDRVLPFFVDNDVDYLYMDLPQAAIPSADAPAP